MNPTRTALAIVVTIALILSASDSQAQTPARDWPAERPPAPLPAREATFPPYEMRTLANGMQVVTVLHHEQPVVSMRLLIRSGSAHDPQDKPGVADLVSALLDQGTTTRSAQEIADQIDFIGGNAALLQEYLNGWHGEVGSSFSFTF